VYLTAHTEREKETKKQRKKERTYCTDFMSFLFPLFMAVGLGFIYRIAQ
jgi:hypothetical protein